MKEMKKWLALLAIAALALSLGGCGGSSSSSSSSNENPGNEQPGDDNGNNGDSNYHAPTGKFATAEELMELLNTIVDGALSVDETSAMYTVDLDSLTAGVTTAGAVNTAATSTTLKPIDFVWHVDPSSPDVFYTVGSSGNLLSADAMTDIKETLAKYAVYVARDIIYYPELDESGFKTVNYDGDPEYAYYYTAEGYTDYIFGTLPASGNGGGGEIPSTIAAPGDGGSVGDPGLTPPSGEEGGPGGGGGGGSIPTDMMHSPSDAYKNPVLHITKPGTYTLKGTWKGQIWIDLGDKTAKKDEDMKVTLILNGVEVSCDVAPALVFHYLYECGPSSATMPTSVSTSNAGANVVIADGTTNTFTGTNVYRLLEPEAKDEDEQSEYEQSVTLQSKRWKMDAAFYSFVSMNISGGTLGSGTLNVGSDYEGLDSELHLTINGGKINVEADDDGINVNEDRISVFTMNGGTLDVTSAGGDGIDSNGWIVVNGGTLTASVNNANSGGGLAGLDADDFDQSVTRYGIFITGGNVTTDGTIGGVSQTGGTLTDTTQSNSR